MKSRAMVIALLVLTIGGSAYAQDAGSRDTAKSPAGGSKRDDLRRLLEVTGTAKIGEQIWSQMFQTIRRSAPKVPEAEWALINQEFSAEFASGKFSEMIITIYEPHFTQEEVRELIAFYESPIGKKVISVMPQIVQEALAAGQDRGKEILRRVHEKLRQKGYSVPTA